MIFTVSYKDSTYIENASHTDESGQINIVPSKYNIEFIVKGVLKGDESYAGKLIDLDLFVRSDYQIKNSNDLVLVVDASDRNELELLDWFFLFSKVSVLTAILYRQTKRTIFLNSHLKLTGKSFVVIFRKAQAQGVHFPIEGQRYKVNPMGFSRSDLSVNFSFGINNCGIQRRSKYGRPSGACLYL